MVENDPSFRMAERFSWLRPCQGSSFGRPPEAARFARPGQGLSHENNGLHANNGSMTKRRAQAEFDLMVDKRNVSGAGQHA
jgi:hypothetical protein